MRLSLLSLLLIAAISLEGQSENKGKFYLSGNTSFTYANNFRNTFEQASFEASHLGFFLTNRLMVGAEIIAGTNEDLYDNSPIIMSPFVRYYLPINRGKNTQFFAEAGLGTFGNFSFGSSYETDFYLGLGAERNFGDGVVGTARLRYKANASGLNYTELDLGLNFIIGGKQNWNGFAARKRGAFLIDPNLGRIGFGHRSRDNVQDLRLDLNLGLGYFITQNLLVEAGGLVESSNATLNSLSFTGISSSDWQAFVGLRYFLPATTGRLQPFLLARAGWAGSSTEFEGTAFGLQASKESDSFGEVGAGTLYYLTNKAALDFSIRYQTGLDFPVGRAQAMVGSVGLKVFLGEGK